MKTPRISSFKRGFTLIELMVAMAITAIIVTVLVSITSMAVDTWNRSRAELRASRQAKAMVDSMARDFEALVTRRGNPNEWLSAESGIPSSSADVPDLSSNASKLVFFVAATDRYNGAIGGTGDNGGDVSCVAYRLDYKDPISGGTAENQTFVLNRYLVDPKPTFDALLGKTDKANSLSKIFKPYEVDLNKLENFICENVYQFTASFHVEVTKNTGTATAPKYQTFMVPLTMGDSNSGQKVDSFRLLGTGIEAQVSGTTVGGTTITADEIKAGRLAAVQISLTVLSDTGVDAIRRNEALAAKPEFLAKNSYNYSKLVQLPSM